MFDGKPYVTSRIMESIPVNLQMLMLELIDAKKKANKELDYLQVFLLKSRRLNESNWVLQIIHKQEVPEDKTEMYIKINDPVDAKIFVIDDGTHCTMMFADEY